MSFSDIKKTRDRFAFVRHEEPDAEPMSQIPASIARNRPITTPADLARFIVVCDGSRVLPCNLSLNTNHDPFKTPSEEEIGSSRQLGNVEMPILYHSAGLWTRSKKFRSKVDMRDLYYQHFLNIKRVADYQFQVLSGLLMQAKRTSNVKDAIAISLFLHESSGLRLAIDSDVELFRKWKAGEYRGLRRKLSSERMLFKGYVELLDDHWKHLTSQELFELPILRMLSRTPYDIISETQDRVKSVNQRSYMQTLMYVVDGRDRGHTLY